MVGRWVGLGTCGVAPGGSAGRSTDGPGGAAADLRRTVAGRLRQDAELAGGQGDRPALRRAVARALAAEGVVAAPEVWARLVRDLVDEFGGLGVLEGLLRDPTVTVTRTLARLGQRLDPAHAFADAVLPAGVRLHAVLPPLADRATVTLRRVPAVVPSWDDLERAGAVPAALRDRLVAAVQQRRNVVVCGRAGVGKTTLLARLLAEVGSDRVVVIEDAPELQRPAAHTVHLRTRIATPDGVGGVDVATLVRNALRMRPDRLVVGEVRGAETADLLQAMNTGHDGSMTTLHANGVDEAVVRMEGMALLAGVPLAAAQAQVAAALDLVVAMERGRDGARRVRSLAELALNRDRGRPRVVWSC